MKQIYNFLSILNAIIQNKSVLFTYPADYGELFSIADSQNLYALIYAKLAECQEFISSPIAESIMTKSMKVVARQIQRTDTFLELYQAFSREQIYPIVMKGIVCRQLYGELCDYRPSGDEDILIHKEDFYKIKNIMIENGFQMESMLITQRKLEKVKEISFYQRDSAFHIEVHLKPFGNSAKYTMEMNSYLDRVFERMIEIKVNNVLFKTMGYTDHLLYLIFHAMNHFTGGGFGIRQVLDILLFVQTYENMIEWNEVRQVLGELKIDIFFSDMIHLGNQYLGFRLNPLCNPHCPEDMLDDVMRNGIFGIATEEQHMAALLTSAAVSTRNKQGIQSKIKTWGRLMFPSYEQMLEMHPELVEKPNLVVKLWIQRWGRFFKKVRKRRNLVAEGMQVGTRRIEMLKKYGIL